MGHSTQKSKRVKRADTACPLFGHLKGQVTALTGDSLLSTGQKWNAESARRLQRPGKAKTLADMDAASSKGVKERRQGSGHS